LKSTYLAQGINSSGVREVRPEILPDVLHRIDPQPINIVRLRQVGNPGVEHLHIIIVLRVQVRKRHVSIAQPALLYVGLVVEREVDETERMEGAGGIERRLIDTVVDGRRAVRGLDFVRNRCEAARSVLA
jgi:hypothetical protein